MVRPRIIIAFLVVVGAFSVLISLGNWQMRRLAWKEDLIARVAERMASPPLDLKNASPAEFARPDFLAANEYRPVILSGEFRPQATVRSYTALSDPNGPLQGPGYWVLTYLQMPDGQGLFVNRGFIPFEYDGALPSPPAGIVGVSGIVRAPETGNIMTPEPDIENRVWYARNVAEMATALSPGGEVLPFFLDADASATPESGLPQAGETRTMFANNHLQYAITWYGLAGVLACVFGAYVLTRRKGAGT